MKKILGLISASALLLAVFGSAHADLIQNGSFEEDTQGNESWTIYPSLTGWAGGDAGIELRNDVAGTAYHGVNYIELDTTRNSVASQVIDTAEVWYMLSFAYSPRINQAASTNDIAVFWNGDLQGVYSGDGSGSHVWQVISLYVLGGDPESTLMFRAGGTSDSYGGSLDAVSLVAVPEPSTLALLGLGLLGVSFGRRKMTS